MKKNDKLPGYLRLKNLKMDQPVYGIGLMSGTSVDGVDAALVRIDMRDTTPLQVVEFIQHPISNDLHHRILQGMNLKYSTVELICQLNVEIGELFAEAANAVIEKSGIAREKIEFIGSHGQTVYHIPEVDKERDWLTPSTLQLGDSSVIAERTGIKTVADFRLGDMAAGGTGAPLIPFLEAFLFANSERDVLCQNIGGIANCTLIQSNGTITAFDTGPGNMIMDELIKRRFPNKRYDENGKLARKGKVDEAFLSLSLEHPFFQKPPPKATGHEDFGVDACYNFTLIKKRDDALATACELTAVSIVQAYRNFIFPKAQTHEVIVSGGGTKNAYLMERLADLCPELQWKTMDDYGISSDAKEAAGFALMAFATLNNIPSNIPSVTSAKKEMILGKVVVV